MAKRGAAAINVNLVMRNIKILHGKHRDAGKSFVHFPQINFGNRPASGIQTFFDRAYRGCCEIFRFLCVRRMGDDPCDRFFITRF